MNNLVEKLIAGETRAAARVMRLVDDRAPGHLQLLKELYAHVGRAYVIGITGTPGAGKSTLVDKLIDVYRKQGKRVGVVAVDPSSPFTGGAILGDRIRMQRHFLDEQVFIRSIATRGAMGGLSRSATDVVRVLDAWGADVILVETVGVGQDELDVTRTANTTLVVVPPGGGDDVQANKAGILEIADVFVVNKADREGADAQVRYLESMIALGQEIKAGSRARPMAHGHGAQVAVHVDDGSWEPPVLKTVSARAEGIDALVAAIEKHGEYRKTETGRAEAARKSNALMLSTFRDVLVEEALSALGPAVNEAADAVRRGERDPYSAVEALVAKFRAG